MSAVLSKNQMQLDAAIEEYQMEGTLPLNDESAPPPSDLPERSWSIASSLGESFAIAEENESRHGMRVRITNEVSGRFKDLIIHASEDVNIFDSIYDNHEVKTNHVRKWSSDKIREVKAGTAEIYISVVDDKTTRSLHSYSIDEMKKTSVGKLHKFSVQPRSVINLLLRCEKKNSFEPCDSTSSFYTSPFQSSGPKVEVPLSPNSSDRLFTSDSIGDIRQTVYGSTSISSSKSLLRTPVSDHKPSAKGTIRVRVMNETTERSKDLLIDVDNELNMYDAIYNDKEVKKANVRKWGPKIAAEVKEKTSEIKCLLWDESIQRPYHTFSVDELKTTSTTKLFEIAAEPMGIIKLVLRCEAVETPDSIMKFNSSLDLDAVLRKASGHSKSSSIGDPADVGSLGTSGSSSRQLVIDDLTSVKSRNLAELESIRQEIRDTRSVYSTSLETLKKETMRVRVVNPHTSRYKDLVIDVRDDLLLFHAIYNNPGVKAANVRKWSSQVVQDVQRGLCEILLEVWDESIGAACRILSINDSMSMSTKDLMEIAPETSDLIEVRLRCSKKPLENDTPEPELSLKQRTSLSELDAKTAISQSKRTGSGSMPARHMAHMSSGNMKNLGLDGSRHKTVSGSCLKESMSSFHDQINMRSNYQFGLSALSEQRNHSWQASQKGTRQQPQLFSSHVNATFSLMSNSKQSQSKTHGERNKPNPCQQKAGEKHVVTVDDKVQRFLSLSNGSQTGSNAKKPTEKQSSLKENGDKAMLRHDSQKAMSSIEDATNAQISSSQSSSVTSPRHAAACGAAASAADPMKEFKRLCRSKQSKEISEQKVDNGTPIKFESSNAKIKRFLRATRVSTGEISKLQDEGNSEVSLGSLPASNMGSNTDLSKQMDGAEFSISSDVNRRTKPGEDSENERLKRFLSRTPNDFVPPQPTTKTRRVDVDEPPVAEISVVTTGPISSHARDPALTASAGISLSGISLSGDIVKEVFPYHVVLDSDFRIVQIGNSLSKLFEGSGEEDSAPQSFINFVGRIVSDVFMITGPIPTFGKWDWSVLDRMNDKTIFFESVLSESSRRKVRLKGTIVEIAKSPRQIMLSLLPNVKNLTELSEMELSMGDLPLHSCQREAVLLGEHSASEVKLTNHLDMLHRDLINSMEQQIKDRTAELAMANEDLERANTQVQQQSARQLEHFACMSHEIRTPLNCIVGMSSVLLEETHSKIDPMHTESIEMIYNSGELLRAVVDDVLDYAKLESGSFEVDVCKVNLQESITGVAHSISQKIQEKNIRLRCQFSPDLPKFTETDSRRLQQVLFNLLGNSGKFSKRNSVIDLSIRLVPKARKDGPESLAVEWRGDANQLNGCDIIRFSVKDYGKGIEMKDFKTIFQPFSQASKQTATVYGGTGLGLSITSKLVNRLGGRIAVDSEIGKFTEFIVDLPLKGETVDRNGLKGRLKDLCIVTVKPKERFDYTFTTYPIAEEPEPFGSNVRTQYDLNVVSTHSVEELDGRVKQLIAEQSGKHFALLVDETLYDDRALAGIIKELGPKNCTLMTFGPNYDIVSTKERHLRSLLGVFPCILLDSIATLVARSKEDFQIPEEKEESAELSVNPKSDGSRSTAALSGSRKLTKTDDSSRLSAQGMRAKRASKQSSSKRDLKVLYAEDNKINQKVLTRVLNRVGIMDVTIVDDGLKAVNISENEKYDIIFMDMQMPVMDGVEACNLIIERDSDAKVIFVTAHALDEFKHKARAAGGVGFISKPFRIEDIEKVLGRLDLS